MNKFTFIKFLVICLFFYTKAHALSPINLCLTGKVELMLPSYKSSFINAVNLSLRKSHLRKELQIKTYFFDSKPLSSIRAYKEMIKDHCSAIIGFEYLSDLLLVSTIQNDTKIPIFTSFASSNASDTIPENIFMFAPTYNFQAKKMLNFIKNKFGRVNNALIITEVDRADLSKYKAAYSDLMNKENISYDTFDFIGDDLQFETKLKKYLINKHYNYVFVLSGAVGSTKIINYMNDHKVIFIGTENFGSSTNQSLYERLNDRNINAFIIRNIDFLKPNVSLDKFKTEYFKEYLEDPSSLSVYTYDSVNIILKTLEKFHSVQPKNILEIDYNGITGAYIKNKIFNRSTKYVILSIGKNGFIYEE